ncbi:MAG: AMIN domain-containing protein [Myxococcales bacterium]|nr:AMIN domain-containing protein [Myxococcales bacterium]
MFRTSIQILIVSVVLLSPGWARASTVNRLTQIRVNEQKSATVITVSGSTQPSFTVFKLINPIRIFVDVANADVRSIADSITVENGVIGQVGALSVRNGTTRIGRIVVTLNRSNFYQVKAVGTEIQIVIEANGRKSRQPTMKLETQRLKLQMLSREILRERELLEKLRGARAKEEQLKSQAETARRREEELRQKLESERKRAEQLRLLAERAKNTVLLAKTKVEKELHNQRQLKRETELARKKEEQRLALLASLVQKKREQQLSLQKAADAQRQRIEALKTQKHQLEAMKKAAIALRLAEEQRKKLAKTSAEIEERKRQAARTARLIEEKVKLSLLQTRKQMEAKIALLRMANRLELERQKALREKRQREELRQKFLIDAVARYKKMAAELQVARTAPSAPRASSALPTRRTLVPSKSPTATP